MIYEVTVSGTYFDQEIVNRWNYLSSGAAVGVTASAALAIALGFVPTAGDFVADTLAKAWQDAVATTYLFNSILVKAIREAPTDFYDFAFPVGVTGADGGANPMSPTMSYGFRTNRTRTDIARGTKRLAGCTEPNVASGGVILEAFQPLLQDICDRMNETVSYTEDGSSLTFAPIVVQKEMYTEPPAKKAYRYYSTIAEQLEHIAQGVVWSYYGTVRTQTSRQYGHGA
jgi:hypothetical protein